MVRRARFVKVFGRYVEPELITSVATNQLEIGRPDVANYRKQISASLTNARRLYAYWA